MTIGLIVRILIVAALIQPAAPVRRELLEVYRGTGGMIINPGSYLYLRVYDDGLCELESSDPNQRGILLKRRLSGVSLAKLKGLLIDDDIKSLKTLHYGRSCIDYSDVSTFRLVGRKRSKTKIVDVPCYEPNYKQEPTAVTTLICTVESIRTGKGGMVFSDPRKICFF